MMNTLKFQLLDAFQFANDYMKFINQDFLHAVAGDVIALRPDHIYSKMSF